MPKPVFLLENEVKFLNFERVKPINCLAQVSCLPRFIETDNESGRMSERHLLVF